MKKEEIWSRKIIFYYDKTPHNPSSYAGFSFPIIPYQEITGNYSGGTEAQKENKLIPYHELTGNYSMLDENIIRKALYHTKK